MGKHKVFISYHHANDQDYKNALETMNDEHEIFVNRSVSLGDIDEDEEPQTIREIIRDKYLRDTTVLILLVGTETKNRKHVDWEVFSSMRDSTINKKSGILEMDGKKALKFYPRLLKIIDFYLGVGEHPEWVKEIEND